MGRTVAGRCAVIAISVLTLGGIAMADDNNAGTWKLNLEKSRFSPGPAPKSETLIIEAWGDDGIIYRADLVGADGKTMRWDFQAKYDGKPYPFKGNPGADTITYRRIDAKMVESITTLQGKAATASRAILSADGKIRTLTQTGVNAKGEKVNNVLVFDKQ